jgi:hypothetical protein
MQWMPCLHCLLRAFGRAADVLMFDANVLALPDADN